MNQQQITHWSKQVHSLVSPGENWFQWKAHWCTFLIASLNSEAQWETNTFLRRLSISSSRSWFWNRPPQRNAKVSFHALKVMRKLYLWDCKENSTVNIEDKCCISSRKAKTTATRMSCSHNLMSVTHKESDHHPDPEQWWLAAITPLWHYQLLMVHIDKDITR